MELIEEFYDQIKMQKSSNEALVIEAMAVLRLLQDSLSEDGSKMFEWKRSTLLSLIESLQIELASLFAVNNFEKRGIRIENKFHEYDCKKIDDFTDSSIYLKESAVDHDDFYPFEPFRTKVVETIKMTTREERVEIVRNANYNLFQIKAEDVMIDLLTDSGTGSMSSRQSACLISGDESYAGSQSFYRFEKAIKDLTGFKFIYPVHQGRAAERILFNVMCKPNDKVFSNGLFDTTRGNIEFLKAVGIDLPVNESCDTQHSFAFKGNICIEKLKQKLKAESSSTAFVLLTITCNSGGGQPVSMQNIKDTRKLCTHYKVPLIFDGCRFAENAYFIKQREAEYSEFAVADIVKMIFSQGDGMTMSAKKDAISHTGGWIGLHDSELAEKVENLLTLTEGFKTYGGLAGRDLDAIAVGLTEVVEEDYLRHRIESCSYLGKKIQQSGVPIVLPVGGHAIFVDAKKLLPHINPLHYPAHSLAIALYIEGGIRAVEIGSFMFGRQPNGDETPAQHELLRLALPRRVYNKNHLDYVARVLDYIAKQKQQLRGYGIIRESRYLRHFNSSLAPL